LSKKYSLANSSRLLGFGCFIAVDGISFQIVFGLLAERCFKSHQLFWITLKYQSYLVGNCINLGSFLMNFQVFFYLNTILFHFIIYQVFGFGLCWKIQGIRIIEHLFMKHFSYD
jgi:hypothetical protein